VAITSLIFGCARVTIAVLSANCSNVVATDGTSMKLCLIFCIKACSVSTAKRKMRGDNGSPCRNPFIWKKFVPHKPFILRCEEDDMSKLWIQTTQSGGKPLALKTSNKNSHDT
jgi:hypothetical protein